MLSKVIFREEAQRHLKYGPLYDFDPRTGAVVEVFYADHVLAASFGKQSDGWMWWTCWRGDRPCEPSGPFNSSYRAYRDALIVMAD
jgi:hypothetical protein